MQCRKLDGNSGIVPNIGAFAGLGNLGNRVAIGQMITLGIGCCSCRFPQHIVRIGESVLFLAARPAHGRMNGFPEHKLPAEFFHDSGNRLADHRFAQPLDGRMQDARNGGIIRIIENLTGHKKGPCGRIDKCGVGMVQMFAPLGRGDLVFNQSVNSFAIWHPQQRFSETHQGNTFF